MNWDLAIEKNRQALKRMLIVLFGLAGFAAGSDGVLRAGGGEGILRRARRNAVLRLLRPAESAVRRLIILAARSLTLTLPAYSAEAQPKANAPVQSIVTMVAGVRTRMVWQAGAQFPKLIPLPPKPPLTRLGFPLLDPLRMPFQPQRRYVPPHRVPRITALTANAVQRPLPTPPSPDDYLDATRLGLRLAALDRVLDDLAREARRLAFWRARRERSREQGRSGRYSSMKHGLAPGMPRPRSRQRHHEIHDILREVHGLVLDMPAYADTS